MSSLNECQFIGNLGRDPEVKSTQNGDRVANLSLGVNETWRDKQTGEKRQRTEWVRIVLWGNLAEIAEKYLRKSSKVYIRGQMQTRKWQDQNGQDRYTTEIVLRGIGGKMVMLDGKPQQGGSQQEDYPGNPDLPGYGEGGAPGGGDLDGEIPF